MAGRPRTRARREAEQRGAVGDKTRAKRADPGTVQRVLTQIAAGVPIATAAREAGVDPARARKWVARAKDKQEPIVPLPDESVTEGDPLTRAERLRVAADKARAASSKALDQADAMLDRGLASESRNAAVVAGVHADRAAELEAAAREEEEHEQRLTEQAGQAVVELIEQAFTAVALPAPRELLRTMLRDPTNAPDPELADRARAEVRRTIAGEVRAQILAEIEAQRRTRPVLAAGESEAEPEPPADDEVVDAEVVHDLPSDSPDLPTWEDLPEDYKARHALNRGLGIYTYAQDMLREQRARERTANTASRRQTMPDFRHPGLRDLS
jgi:hypothetical protein